MRRRSTPTASRRIGDRAEPAPRRRRSSRAPRCGSTSRKGPKPVAVPNVVGLELRRRRGAAPVGRASRSGASTSRATSPAGQVVDQSPPGNSTASKGSSVTLSVSKGPTTVTVPDVSLQTVADARATLRAAGFKVTVVRQDTDDESLDGLVMSQDPAGNTQADPKSVVTLTVGTYVPPPDVTPRRRRHDTTTDRRTTHDDHPVSGRVRLAVLAGGRSSEHEISLASARSVAAALDPARYDVTDDRDRPRRPLGAPAGRPPARRATGDDAVRDAARSRGLGPGDARRGRRRAADPPRPLRRGRHRPGPARARRRRRTSAPGVSASALCMDKDLFKALMRGDRGIPVARHVTLRPGDAAREPVRLPGVRQARTARLVGRHLEGPRRGRARRGRRARAPPRREGAGRGVRGRRGGRGRRPRQPRADRVRRRARSSRTPTGTTTPRSTTRAAWSSSCRRRISPDGDGAGARARASALRGHRLRGHGAGRLLRPRPDGEVVVNELNTIPGFTATSFYARLFDACGDPVRRAARPADRARAGAARARAARLEY